MIRPRAVILNDTSTRFHHGCARVMRLLVVGLEGAGFEVTARSPARADWARDARFLAALRAAQVVVINGEGTLHDGAPLGARLLSVLDHEAARDKPVALVNALWQDNPPDWDRWLPRLAIAAARDRDSAAAMRQGGAAGARWLPDLSLSAPGPAGTRARRGLIVGDSVRLSARGTLGLAAQRLGALYVPTKTLQSPVWRSRAARGLLWRAYCNVWRGPVPPIEMPPHEEAYLARLGGAEGHVTGRFHGVCLSWLAGTPVLALGSRTSKVERLLRDAGMGDDRLLTPERLERLGSEEAARPWTEGERDAIGAFLALAGEEAGRLYADIRALAG